MGVNRKDTKADWIDPNEIPDLSTDTDGDGVTDGQEKIDGTDPNDPDSYLRIIDIAPVEGGFLVTWTSVRGKFYRLEYQDGVQDPWNVLDPAIPASSGATTSYFDATGVPSRFYMVHTLVDTDWDGSPDDLEEIAETDPEDPASVLKIEAVEWLVPGPGVRVGWQTVVGRSYTLQKAPAPDGPWTNVGDAVTADAVMTWREDTEEPVGEAFYRALTP